MSETTISSQNYRERCLEEKGEQCRKCGATEGIIVHHIDGDRSNNRLENLLPLCWSCHQKVHRCADGFEELYDQLQSPDYGPSSEAAFSSEETEKTTVYGTEETLHEYRASLSMAKGMAMIKYDLENVKDRELHNAALQVGSENVVDIVERIVAEREK